MSISSLDSDESECFICNEKLPEPAMSLLDYEVHRQCECSAKIHAKCYARWLLQSKSCPVCRKPLLIGTSRVHVHEHISVDLLPNYVEVVRPIDNFRAYIIRSFISIFITLIVVSAVILIIVST
jgi:hypothetical protein